MSQEETPDLGHYDEYKITPSVLLNEFDRIICVSGYECGIKTAKKPLASLLAGNI